MKAAAIILAIVGILNWGYAVLRTIQGTPIGESLPLVIGGLICFTLIVVLNARGRKKP